MVIHGVRLLLTVSVLTLSSMFLSISIFAPVSKYFLGGPDLPLVWHVAIDGVGWTPEVVRHVGDIHRDSRGIPAPPLVVGRGRRLGWVVRTRTGSVRGLAARYSNQTEYQRYTSSIE